MPYNMACRSVNLPSPLMKSIRVSSFPVFSTILPAKDEQKACMLALSVRTVKCSAVQETSTSTASAETKETNVVKKAAPAPKPKVPAKAPAKPLPQLMEEDVVPSLKATFEAQDDLSEIEVFFQDNRVSTLSYNTCIQNIEYPAFYQQTLDQIQFETRNPH
ncbi:hypothetical protein AQUCO_00500357v1 [Aquilegia coerulea]|uniref:Uncharacterized protein n=1 Tax=Aquilegia coerulea TaxID=218851 RepID=A0A2G5ERM3_AQUCA|nr:hypothetical protein AQUCO_00500357v1 [Aquilegia coerulea]